MPSIARPPLPQLARIVIEEGSPARDRYTEEAHGENQAPGRAHPGRDRTQVPLCQRQLTVRFKDMTEEESAPLGHSTSKG
jgi:hypothetical protein